MVLVGDREALAQCARESGLGPIAGVIERCEEPDDAWSANHSRDLDFLEHTFFRQSFQTDFHRFYKKFEFFARQCFEEVHGKRENVENNFLRLLTVQQPAEITRVP